MQKREALYGRINRYLLWVYIAINLFMAVLDLYRGDVFHYMLAFGSLLFKMCIRDSNRTWSHHPRHPHDT